MKTFSRLLSLILIALIAVNAQARYYDPDIGRFISPDSIVQAPTDPQSLNRYSYVRNNPLNRIDPSGHSWLSKSWHKLEHWTQKHSEFTGLVMQTFDPFSGSLYLSRSENGRAILMGQVIAAGSFGLGGTAVGWGAVSGEISSAYTARKTGGNIFNAVVLGGIEGAAIAGTFSGIDATKGSWVARGIAKANINAIITAAHGGDMNSIGVSWGLSFGAEAASNYFTKTVGEPANPTPGTRLDTAGQTYVPNKSGQPPLGKNVFGVNTAGESGLLHQGSWAMTSLDAVPGMQSVSQLHDSWLNNNNSFIFGSQKLTNIFTMPAAAIVSYSAQFAGPWAPFLTHLP